MADALFAMLCGPLMWVPMLNILVGWMVWGVGRAIVGLAWTLLASGIGSQNQAVRTKDREWWDVLGVSPGASQDEIRRAYRERARAAHPDVGGSEAEMQEINRARETALRKTRSG